jgi:hypothetical protein
MLLLIEFIGKCFIQSIKILKIILHSLLVLNITYRLSPFSILMGKKLLETNIKLDILSIVREFTNLYSIVQVLSIIKLFKQSVFKCYALSRD